MNKKYVIASFEIYENDAFRDYLEHMALQGWKLKKPGSFFLQFEACSPHPIRYCVEVMEKAGAFISDQTPERRSYREFCQDAGWDYVGSNGLQHIFSTEDPDALPVETDTQERYEHICRVCRKNVWLSSGLLLLMALLNLHFCVSFGAVRSINGFAFLLLAAVSLYISIHYLIWKRRAARTLREDGTLPSADFRRLRRRSILLILGSLLSGILFYALTDPALAIRTLPFAALFLVCYVLTLMFFSFFIRWLREKKAFSRRTNLFLYWGSVVVFILIFTAGINLLIFHYILR